MRSKIPSLKPDIKLVLTEDWSADLQRAHWAIAKVFIAIVIKTVVKTVVSHRIFITPHIWIFWLKRALKPSGKIPAAKAMSKISGNRMA